MHELRLSTTNQINEMKIAVFNTKAELEFEM